MLNYKWLSETIAFTYAGVILCGALGLTLKNLIPHKLRPIYGIYLSPAVGLAILLLLATLHGFISAFSTAICRAEFVLLVALTAYFAFKHKARVKATYLLYLFLLTFLIVSVIYGFEILSGMYYMYPDGINYMTRSQLLQKYFVFSDSFFDSPLRMAHDNLSAARRNVTLGSFGHSFYFAWVQSVIGAEWSYRIYPVAVTIPVIVGSLAGGAVVWLFRRKHDYLVSLTPLVLGITLNGLALGAFNNFFAQTLGLVFLIAFVPIFSYSVAGLRHEQPAIITRFLRLLPLSLLFSGLPLCYSALFMISSAALLFFIIFSIILFRNHIRTKGLVTNSFLMFFQLAILLSFYLVFFIKGLWYAILQFGLKTSPAGWSVPFSPFQYISQAFGLISPGGYISTYDFHGFQLNGLGLILSTTFMALAILYIAFSFRQLRFFYKVNLLLVLCILGIFFVTFLKNRYITQPLIAGDTGNTYLQWKSALWASTFLQTLFMSSLAFVSRNKKRLSVFFALVISAFIIYGALNQATELSAARFDAENATVSTDNFSEMFSFNALAQGGFFNVLLDLREAVKHVKTSMPIFFEIEKRHYYGSLSHLIVYILYDVRLAGDWDSDKERVIFFRQEAEWIIRLDDREQYIAPGEFKHDNIALRRFKGKA